MLEEVFISKTANNWIKDASLKPIPKMLFSEFWFEGEICVLFADTNVGKSILAIQIGDSISKGIPIKGFKLEAEKLKVLYADFELSDKQLEKRYSEDFKNHYEFDDDLIRLEINQDSKTPLNEENLITSLETEILKQETKVVIIDNITYLSQDNEKAKFALELMKKLKALKMKHNLSLLVLSHTPKRDFNQPISKNDLQGSKMLINFFDSAFAIGASYSNANLKYFKQIKQRSSEEIFHSNNICLCELNKGENKNFLQFEFLEFGCEYDHLNINRDVEHEERKLEAAKLKQEGYTNVQIGEKFGVSESAVRKWLK
jgi:RecA-family ATPase